MAMERKPFQLTARDRIRLWWRTSTLPDTAQVVLLCFAVVFGMVFGLAVAILLALKLFGQL